MDLLAALLPGEATDPELVTSRMKIISQTPSLMQKEMERLSAIHDDVCSILYLRLRRHAQLEETEAAIREQSTLIAHLIPGLVRFKFEQPHIGATPSEKGPTSLLTAALKKLIPPDRPAHSVTDDGYEKR